jgi:sensor histidine kinase YesM
MTSRINNQINDMFTTSIVLNKMVNQMASFEMTLEDYLSTKSSDSLVNYLDIKDSLTVLNETLDAVKSDNSTQLQLYDIRKIVDAYLGVADEAVEFKRARNTERYLETLATLKDYSGYINLKVTHLETEEFQSNLENYLALTDKMKVIQLTLMIIVVLIIILSFTFVYSFSTNVTQPIEELSRRADAISRGQYNVKKIHGHHFQEAEVLKTAFYDMAHNINQYINELEGKVETENKLRISETEKLKMQNLLRQAEIMALQSQINPHFLFNTLNAGMQLAYIEGADRTAEFLDHLGKLFRYNIQRLDKLVTLRDEIDNAQNYYALMKVRFGSSLQMSFDVDELALTASMPPIILQPIIENALIHGFEQKTTTGRIQILVRREEDLAVISIEDNGEGIESSTLQLLNSGDFEKKPIRTKGHTTGLGLGNVYERLRQFFEADDVMRFESEKHQYTRVIIKIPMEAR